MNSSGALNALLPGTKGAKNLSSEQNNALIIQAKTQLILIIFGFYDFRDTEKKVY